MMYEPQPHPHYQQQKQHRMRLRLQSFHGFVGIAIRIFFFLFGAFGVVFSVLTVNSCEFVSYTPGQAPDGVNETRHVNITTSASVGLYKYNPDYEGCRDINKDKVNISWQFHTARICAVIAVIIACVALLLEIIDVALCRFVFSRILISVLFLLAFVAQCLTMLVYASQACQPNYKHGPYTCREEIGTWYSVVAICIYLLCSPITCCMPKPLPLCIQLREHHSNDKKDRCCVLCRKVDQEQDKADELVEEEEVLLLSTEQHILQQNSHAAITTALISARHGKQDEIERQLLLLNTYKELLTPEEYQERATKLLLALPDPETYDTYTKTTELVCMDQDENGSDDTEAETLVEAHDDKEGEVDADKLRKEKHRKPVLRGIGAGAAATAVAVKRPFEGMKKKNQERKQKKKEKKEAAAEKEEARPPADDAEDDEAAEPEIPAEDETSE